MAKRRKLGLIYQKVFEALGAVGSLAGHNGEMDSRVQTEQDSDMG